MVSEVLEYLSARIPEHPRAQERLGAVFQVLQHEAAASVLEQEDSVGSVCGRMVWSGDYGWDSLMQSALGRA